MPAKPKLIAMRVPWSIAVDLPHLELSTSADGAPEAAVFTAYCKRVLAEGEAWDGTSVAVVGAPEEFRRAQEGERAEYHRVRLRFAGGVTARRCACFSDGETLDSRSFDTSGVPTYGLLGGETVLDFLDRNDRYFLDTGFSGDPGFYEVVGSSWLAEVAPDRTDLHHYILLGDDCYVEVIATRWDWELGQAA